jgi:putative oxidoreductase
MSTIKNDTKLNIFAKWISWTPYMLSIFRIVVAILFLISGTIKLFAFPVGVPPLGGTVPLFSQAGVGGVLETFGGLLILIGLYTRPIAFILSGEMAVAYFQFHAPAGLWPQLNNGLPAVLFCFIWFYFSVAGSGPWSVDAFRAKRDARLKK